MDAYAPIRSRSVARLVAVLALALVAGCAQPGPFAERRTMIGSLRSSVAQLESEKFNLQKELSQVRADNRDLEDRLVQREAENATLARRLDDMRKVVRGGDGFEVGGDPLSEPDFSPSETFEEPRQAIPAAQPRGRKVPFAQIPGQIRPLPDDRTSPEPEGDRYDGSDLFPPADDLGMRDDSGSAHTRWLPVARGIGRAPSRR
jgi:outer membrane murein-binding lipoprotein Lpp